MQKTNIPVDLFFKKTYKTLSERGKIFVDTKNANWEKFEKQIYIRDNSHRWFNFLNLKKSAKYAGFKNVIIKGFLADENKLVEPEKSHTIFLIAEK